MTGCGDAVRSPRMKYLLLALPLVIASCAGSHSTIRDGYAFKMTKSQAANLVKSTMEANIVSDRMLPTSELVASGYDRSLIDTQTYTLTAVPVPAKGAYGLELNHNGTMFNGPVKANAIFQSAVERASVTGTKVSINP